jgi:hypothetical protein
MECSRGREAYSRRQHVPQFRVTFELRPGERAQRQDPESLASHVLDREAAPGIAVWGTHAAILLAFSVMVERGPSDSDARGVIPDDVSWRTNEWDHSTFTRNRERLIEAKVARKLLRRVLLLTGLATVAFAANSIHCRQAPTRGRQACDRLLAAASPARSCRWWPARPSPGSSRVAGPE